MTAAAAQSLQSCLTLCDPIDGSPPGSSVSGILQARILEWVAISFSMTVEHMPPKLHEADLPRTLEPVHCEMSVPIITIFP